MDAPLDYYDSLYGNFDNRKLNRVDIKIFYISSKDGCILNDRGSIPMFNSKFIERQAAEILQGLLGSKNTVFAGSLDTIKAYKNIFVELFSILGTDYTHPRNIVINVVEKRINETVDISATKSLLLSEMTKYAENITLNICFSESIQKSKSLDPIKNLIYGAEAGPVIVLGGEDLLYSTANHYQRELLSVTHLYQNGYEYLPNQVSLPNKIRHIETFSLLSECEEGGSTVPAFRFSRCTPSIQTITENLVRSDYLLSRKNMTLSLGKFLGRFLTPKQPHAEENESNDYFVLEDAWIWGNSRVQLPWIHRTFDILTLWNAFSNIDFNQIFLSHPVDLFQKLEESTACLDSRECHDGLYGIYYTFDSYTRTFDVTLSLYRVASLTTFFHYVTFAILYTKWLELYSKKLGRDMVGRNLKFSLRGFKPGNVDRFLRISIPRDYYCVKFNAEEPTIIDSAEIEHDERIYNYPRAGDSFDFATKAEESEYRKCYGESTPATFETTVLWYLLSSSKKHTDPHIEEEEEEEEE